MAKTINKQVETAISTLDAVTATEGDAEGVRAELPEVKDEPKKPTKAVQELAIGTVRTDY